MIVEKTDCFDRMPKLPASSFELILTDPPFLISKKSGFSNGGSWNNANDKSLRKTPPKTYFGKWDTVDIDFNEMFKQFYRLLKDGGYCIVFVDIWKAGIMKMLAEKHRFKQPRLCRWDKTNPVPVNSKRNYLSNGSEYFITFTKGVKPTFNSEYDRGIYSYPICSGKERTKHTTQKPLALISELVKKHSNAGDTVFDPFAGSGTTAVACMNLGRNFYMIEKDNTYYEIMTNRISKYEKEAEK